MWLTCSCCAGRRAVSTYRMPHRLDFDEDLPPLDVPALTKTIEGIQVRQ